MTEQRPGVWQELDDAAARGGTDSRRQASDGRDGPDVEGSRGRARERERQGERRQGKAGVGGAADGCIDGEGPEPALRREDPEQRGEAEREGAGDHDLARAAAVEDATPDRAGEHPEGGDRGGVDGHPDKAHPEIADHVQRIEGGCDSSRRAPGELEREQAASAPVVQRFQRLA